MRLLAVTPNEAGRLRRDIAEAITRLRALGDRLDPIKRPDAIFDLSNPEYLGKFIGRTMMEQERHALGSVARFYGSGVYAIYYCGPFKAYAPIKGKDTPIYVGKADPPTPAAKTYIEQGPKLASRLAEHAKSVRAASSTLKIDDFDCRYLVVQSGWQRSAEDYLLRYFMPIWNQAVCYGFGKHGDDPGTRRNQRSPWDTLHPGRIWATREGNTANDQSPNDITKRIAEHFEKFVPVR